MKYSKLFTKGSIATLTARNRIAMPAIHIGLAEDGAPSDAFVSFYERRAAGGVGVITVGVCNTWPKVESSLSNFLDLSKDATLVRMAELTRRVKAQGALIGVQISPLTGYNNPKWRPEPDELPDLLDSIGTGAKRAMDAGFDFVEVMLSGGSVLSHFLSPVYNTFEIPGYGGDFEGRSRAVVEAIRAVRRHTEDGIPLLARIHGHEFLGGGYGSEGATRIAKLIEAEGGAGVNVTGGGHRTALPQITFHTPPMIFAHLTRQVREATRLPVFVGGQLRLVQHAEEALRVSGADFVNLARALVADPDWPEKAALARQDEIVPCMACCKCFDQAVGGKPLRCSLNPGVGEAPVESSGGPRRALVVGSGPAGLQAAWDLQKLGHEVAVWEREPALGGRWRVASALGARKILVAPLQAFVTRLERAGVDLVTGKTATPEAVSEFSPDILVLAVGAKPRDVEIPGLEKHGNVLLAEDAIENPGLVGDRAVIVGAGGVGVELAIHLAGLGEPALDTLGFLARYGDRKWLDEALEATAGRKVTLIRRRGFAGKGLGRSIRWTMVKEMERLGVEVIDRCEYRGVTDKGLEILHKRSDEERCIEADTIILATGYEPQPELYERFKDLAETVLLIGSAETVSNIGDAVAAGYGVPSEI